MTSEIAVASAYIEAISAPQTRTRRLGLCSILPVILVYFILSAEGEAYAVCRALWDADAFGWIGFSVGTFGVFQTMVQAFLPGPATAARPCLIPDQIEFPLKHDRRTAR